MIMHDYTSQNVRGSKGQAFLISIVFFVVASTAVAGAIARPVITDVRLARELEQSKQSYAIAEAGAEDAAYRLKNALPLSANETVSEGGAVATITVTETLDGYEVAVVGNQADRIRKINANFTESSGVGFAYGVQSGEGGLALYNSATVQGNVYSNGPLTGANSHIIKGDVVSAGPTGLIDGIHATGTAYAHTIKDSDIEGDAHYTSISGTNVDGTEYPGAADQATSTLPIEDSLVEIWKNEAEIGGVYSGPCPYEIDYNVTLGPIKIPCDLEVSGSPDPTITLEGAVWVEGNISFRNSPVVRVSSSIGNRSVPFIADNPSDPEDSGKITLEQSTTFEGNGGSRSYVLMLSQNTSAENGGSEQAIVIENSVSGKYLVYAGHGEIEINNSATLKEVTAYLISIRNFAVVIYESGIANLLFTSGPSGGFGIDDWSEE